MTSLEQALVNLAQTLTESNIPYMIIGGMANAVWGEPRATLDIDATIWVSEEEIQAIVSLLGSKFRLLVSDPLAFIRDTHALPLETGDGIGIDIIFATLTYERKAIDRAAEIEVGGIPVRFCTPEDLILHKIISDRERDLADARGVALRRLDSLDMGYLESHIRELADGLERPDVWQCWEQWKQEAEEKIG